jgi:hypothetical protein
MVGAALAAMLAATVPIAAEGQEAPAPDPVLAIVSPIVSPVCTTAGTATLLVPVVGGLVESNTGLGGTIDVGDVLLDALGPIYIVCGNLPAAPGSRCLLDDQIAGLVPAEATETIGPLPPLLGGTFDALVATLGLLGLDVADALKPVLQCDIREPDEAAGAPSAAPELPSVAGVDTIAPPAIAPPPASLGDALAPPSEGLGGVPAAVPTRTVLDLARYAVPGWVQALQIAFGAAVLLFLAGSWATSLRASGEPS